MNSYTRALRSHKNKKKGKILTILRLLKIQRTAFWCKFMASTWTAFLYAGEFYLLDLTAKLSLEMSSHVARLCLKEIWMQIVLWSASLFSLTQIAPKMIIISCVMCTWSYLTAQSESINCTVVGTLKIQQVKYLLKLNGIKAIVSNCFLHQGMMLQ